jgi:protein TonB
MTLITKEPLELGSLAKAGAGPDNSQANATENPRSNPVCLEVPVTIRSLPAEKDSGAQPIREESRTVIVFDNGAVLRLSSTLPEGQGLIISNAQGRDVVCRVVHARNLPTVKGYIEVAFVEPVSDFWSIHQPLASALPPSTVVVASQIVPSEPVVAPPTAPRSADTPKETNETSGNAPTFDDIAGLVRMSPLPSQVRRPSGNVSQTPSLVHDKEFAAGLSEPSKPVTSANASRAAAISKPAAAAVRAITSPSRVDSPSVSDDFMSRGMLNPGKSLAMPAMSESRGKMPLIIGGGLLLLVGLGAGAFFFHQGNTSSPSSSVPATQALSLPPASAAAQPSVAAQNVAAQLTPEQPAVAVSSEAVSAPAVATSPAPLAAPPARTARNSEAPLNRPAAPRQEIPNLKMSRPTAANRNTAIIGDASPSTVPDVVSNIGGAPVGGLLSSASRAPAAPAPPAPPLSSTPMVDPKLISTVRPDYPGVAKQAKIQGVVVIDAEIETTGKVGHAVATSGPAVLREAAIAAVKQWKYQPAQMNGKSVSAHVTVNVNFRLQ